MSNAAMRETTLTASDLRAWRISSGLTQDAAAAQLQVPLRTYAQWEGGEPPHHTHILALALNAIREGVPAWQTPPDLVIDAPRRGRPKKAIIV